MPSHVNPKNGAIPAVVQETSTAAPPPMPAKQKLILIGALRDLLGQILHANLSSMDMALAGAGVCGKGTAIDPLVNFLNNHEHDLVRGKQTTAHTLGIWISDLKNRARTSSAH
jgi:hypothetical protein